MHPTLARLWPYLQAAELYIENSVHVSTQYTTDGFPYAHPIMLYVQSCIRKVIWTCMYIYMYMHAKTADSGMVLHCKFLNLWHTCMHSPPQQKWLYRCTRHAYMCHGMYMYSGTPLNADTFGTMLKCPDYRGVRISGQGFIWGGGGRPGSVSPPK